MVMWPLRTNIKKEESLSSWLIRTALTHGCDPITLTYSLWPSWRAWTHDIDRNLSVEKSVALSNISGVNVEYINRATLYNSAKLIMGSNLNYNGTWPWVMPLGAYNRNYRGGLQFCATCLNQDAEPYFRRHWRFAWITACPEHNVLLDNSCYQCGLPCEPHKLQALKGTLMAFCAHCGFDYRLTKTRRVSSKSLVFQNNSTLALSNQSIFFLNKPILTSEWFSLNRYLISLVRRAVLSPNSKLSRALSKSIDGLDKIGAQQLGLQLEMLSPQTRMLLFCGAQNIIDNIDRFEQNLMHYKVRQNTLNKYHQIVPKPLDFLVRNLTKVAKAVPSQKTKLSNRYQSKHAVLQHWLRIKRKYRIPNGRN